MRGFTLIEMMMVLVIGGILLSISAGAYSSMRQDTLVKTARSQLVTVLFQARQLALTKREAQVVNVNYVDTSITSASGNVYTYEGVDVQNMSLNSCTADTVATTASITFNAGGGTPAPIIMKFSSLTSSLVGYVVVNSITGGVLLYDTCTGAGDYS